MDTESSARLSAALSSRTHRNGMGPRADKSHPLCAFCKGGNFIAWHMQPGALSLRRALPTHVNPPIGAVQALS